MNFPDWILKDYRQFINAYMKYELNNVEAIASEIETKTEQQVYEYLTVFNKRFRELKECD